MRGRESGDTMGGVVIPCLIVTCLVLWLATNLAHREWIATRRGHWEQRVSRGPDGVATDAHPYTCGKGTDAVLLIHGFADTPAVFRELAETLAAHDLTCRVMRLPGAGEPLPVAAAQRLGTWLAAVRDEAEVLRHTHRRVWLLGHSMGGALATLVLINAPDLADGLILLAPLFDVSSARAPLFHPRMWFRIAQPLLPFSRTVESCFPVNVLTSDGSAIAYQRDRFIPFATYRALFTLIDRLRGHSERLNVPVLVVLVADDRVVDNQAAQTWLATHGPTRTHIETLDGYGHAIPLEAQLLPELCQRIADFIRV